MLRWISLIIALCATFFVGYWAGQNSINEQLSMMRDLTSLHKQSLTTPSLPSSKKSSSNHSANATYTDNATDKVPIDELATEDDISFSGDLSELFQQLVALQKNNTDYKLYGRMIDHIRLQLTNSDSDIAQLSEYFETLPDDSQQAYLIISVLQGLPDNKGKRALVNIAEKVLAKGSQASTAQFLEVVGRTGVVNEEITRGLKEIALYNDEIEQSLYALDMLMPFQLSVPENQQVLSRLQEMYNSVDDIGYKNYLFSQTMRFSNNEKRNQIALERLNDSSGSIENKSIVLDYIAQGQIEKSPQARALLMQLAQDLNNPLQIQSIKVLMSGFNLSQEEYQLLIEDQGLEPFNLR